MMGLLLGHSCIIIKWSSGSFVQKFAIWYLLCPLLLGTREYLVLNLFVRIIFIWSEFLLLVFLDKSNFCQNKMKPVGVVEVYATKFSQSRFYWKSRKVWCLKYVLQWIPKIIESTTFVLTSVFDFCFCYQVT